MNMFALNDCTYFGYMRLPAGGGSFSINKNINGSYDLRSMKVDDNLAEFLSSVDIHQKLKDLTKNAQEPNDFIASFESMVTAAVADTNSSTSDLEYLESLQIKLDHLEEIGWENMIDIDEEMSFVVLWVIDRKHQKHEISFSLPRIYPDEKPLVTSDLPIEIFFPWSNKMKLVDAYTIITSSIDQIADYFEVSIYLKSQQFI